MDEFEYVVCMIYIYIQITLYLARLGCVLGRRCERRGRLASRSGSGFLGFTQYAHARVRHIHNTGGQATSKPTVKAVESMRL